MCPQAGDEADQAALLDMSGCFAAPSQIAAPPPPSDRRAYRHTAAYKHRWPPSPGLETAGLDTAPPTYTKIFCPADIRNLPVLFVDSS